MRLGPLEVRLAQKASPPMQEIGATGTVVVQGIVTGEEYNTDLQDEKALSVYDKMRRSDGQVKAALLACSLPIRSATWSVRAASENPQDQEIAEFVRQNLFGMTITWDDYLRHILMAQAFGHMVFEKCWEIREAVRPNQICLRKMAPRLPRTISRWWMDDSGGLDHITQRTWIGGQYAEVDIPVDKLLVFTLDREGSDYRGTSLLRSAYKHWYYKEHLYRIDAVACERHGVGLPVASLQQGATTADRDAAVESLRALRSHHKGYLVEPSPKVIFRIESMQGRALKDVLKSAEHHDVQIARSVLAEFLNLGAGGAFAASYALHRDKSSFFLLALKATADSLVCANINRYLIPQLVDYNYPGVKKYPELAYSRLESRQTKDLADAVAKLVNVGTITPDEDLEAALRDDLQLPPKSKSSSVPPPQPEVKASRRNNLRAEEHFLALDDIEKALDSAVSQILATTKRVSGRQIRKMVQLAKDIVASGRLDRIETVDVPYRRELTAEIAPVLIALYKRGMEEVERELVKQGLKLKLAGRFDFTDAETFLTTRSSSLVSVLSSKMKSAFSWELLNQSRRPKVDFQALEDRLENLSDVELGKMAEGSVAEAFGLGRAEAANLHREDIQLCIYSSVLDKTTCGPCEQADSFETSVGGEDYEYYTPPFRDCSGGPACRCMWIYVMGGEKPEVT